MVTEELRSYVKEMVRHGYAEFAHQELLRIGWLRSDVDSAFSSVLVNSSKAKRSLFLLAAITMSAGVLAAWGGLYTVYSSAPDIVYSQYSEIGDEVVITFKHDISEQAARSRFSIVPAPEGDLVWMDDVRELHFVPYEGFEPDQIYAVDLGLDWRSFLPPFSQRSTFTFAAARAEPIIGKPLPISEQVGTEPVRVIDANMATMQLVLLEDGLAVKRFPIAAIGNPYSAPTPEGGFSIKTKEPKHFSSKTHVWMPYSMQFQGDYFIHGWPYWPDGSRYESKYSGGCIRLEEDIAKEVFEWASIGVTLFIHDEPDRPIVFSSSVIESSDIVREQSTEQAFQVQIVDGKYFKRAYFGSEGNVIPVTDNALDAYQESRWAQFRSGSGEPMYEIGPDGKYYELICGRTPYSSDVSSEQCFDVWELYGGDYDEIFSISLNEYKAMTQGEVHKLVVR